MLAETHSESIGSRWQSYHSISSPVMRLVPSATDKLFPIFQNPELDSVREMVVAVVILTVDKLVEW